MLKCPNPSCPYAFDPSQVPTGVVLSCPRCATQFTLGPPAAAPAQAPRRAPASEPANPEFEEVGRSVEDRDEDEPRPGHRTSKYQVVILAGIAAVLMAGTTLAVVFKLMGRGQSRRGGETALRDKDRNLYADSLPAGWSQDEATRLKIGSPYVYAFKRENPEAYILIGSYEYGRGRPPRGTEMRADLAAPLPKLFDMEQFQKEPPLEMTWLGQKIEKDFGFKFRAPSPDGLIWQGEGYAVQSKGLAFYWIGWCQENSFDDLKDEFAKFRSRMSLLDPSRDGWRETYIAEVAYKGATVPYSFTDAEAIWIDQKESDVADQKKVNPDIDRWLRINHTPRKDRNAVADEADLRVYVLDGSGDPLARGKEYVQDLWVKHLKAANDTLPAPTFTELTDDVQGDPLPRGATPVLRLESRVLDPDTKKVRSTTESRVLVVSAATVGDKTVVLHCWCHSSKRRVFEARFVQVASTLR